MSADGSCESDDGPGVCLVAPGARFRCFPIAEVRAGRAFARTPQGLIVGIVPDGVGRVSLSAGDRTVSARVFDNVYEAKLDVPAGTAVRVEIARPDADDCARSVSSQLLESVATLRRAPGDGRSVPEAALAAVREQWRTSIDAVVEDRARFWGSDGTVDFWVVPVVRLGSRRCAPANSVCVVAISPGTPTGAQCVLQPRRGGAHWRVSPQLPDHAVIHGTVPDGVIGARVTVGKLTAEVAARNNVIGGVLPLPYEDGVHVDLIRRPRPVPPVVGVVDATGISGVAANVLAKIRRSGHPVLDSITPGIEAQPRTDVYWRPQRATRYEAELVAELLRAELRRIANRAGFRGPCWRPTQASSSWSAGTREGSSHASRATGQTNRAVCECAPERATGRPPAGCLLSSRQSRFEQCSRASRRLASAAWTGGDRPPLARRFATRGRE